MSLLTLFDRLGRWLKVYPTINNKQLIEMETSEVKREFIAHFDKDNQAYLQTDYKNFVEKEYPAYLAEAKYNYVKAENFPAKDRPQYALALSGGGIRSAAFGIGVIQALHNGGLSNDDKPSLFSKISYLSTVSGGGYAGSALSWFMKQWGEFPFGELKNFCGSKENLETLNKTEVAKAETQPANKIEEEFGKTPYTPPQATSNKILSYIRLHGNYLTPPGIPPVALVGSALGSVVHSVIAYTLFFSLVMLVLITCIYSDFLQTFIANQHNISNAYYVFTTKTLSAVPSATIDETFLKPRINFSLFFLGLCLLSVCLFFLSQIFHGFASFFTHLFSSHYSYRIAIQKILGKTIFLGFCSLILMFVPLQVLFFSSIKVTNPIFWGSGGTGIGALIMAIMEFRKRLKPTLDATSIYSEVIKSLVIIIFIFLLLGITYWIAELIYHISIQDDTHQFLGISLIYCIIGASVLFMMFVNINYISPHKMYRDRLMGTFLRDPDVDPYAPLAHKGNKANIFKLAELNTQTHWAPYHLINTNIILNKSHNPQYKSRLSDSFLLSPKYCGCDATGYVPTKHFALGSMTLATAMSISGAAANPHAGVGGIGNSTTPLMSFLMTFFGFRLGFWANNPTSIFNRFKFIMRPNYIFPGLSSLLNIGHKETSSHIELSDGGHFDNTGIYELVRRRIPWIILSDGSADIHATFEDLGNALSRIRIDFGVSVRFRDSTLDLSGLLPGSQAASIFDQKFQLAERGYAIGDIIYPDLPDSSGFIGTFVYIKATLTRNLPGDIYAYKADHPEFPNEPTSDQFFSERQFESYRELGYQLTKQLLQNKVAMQRLP